MLKAKDKFYKAFVASVLSDAVVKDFTDVCVHLEGGVTYDQMAEIVDALRKTYANKTLNGVHSEVYSQLTPLQAHRFITSLEKFGYDAKKLTHEYRKTKKITI